VASCFAPTRGERNSRSARTRMTGGTIALTRALHFYRVPWTPGPLC
jgi:hypothetical protein